MSHTPGPWFTTRCSNGGKLVHRGIGHELTTQCVQIIPDADADLIAAAPDLIASVSKLIAELELNHLPDANCSCHISPPCDDCVNYSGLRDVIKSAYAALAKAKGKS